MYEITLISTRHRDLGKCNSHELYKILESIKPNIIFEEIPPNCFDEYYISKKRENLESNAIDRYIQNYKIDHIPVDSNNVPPENFFNDYKYMFEKVEHLIDVNGFTLRNLIDTNKMKIREFGFAYLNSRESANTNKEIYKVIESGLIKISNEKLFEIFNKWKQVNETREKHMLKNIYQYSKENIFEKAIFTLGAAHRFSLIEKIPTFQENEKVKLNWKL